MLNIYNEFMKFNIEDLEAVIEAEAKQLTPIMKRYTRNMTEDEILALEKRMAAVLQRWHKIMRG